MWRWWWIAAVGTQHPEAITWFEHDISSRSENLPVASNRSDQGALGQPREPERPPSERGALANGKLEGASFSTHRTHALGRGKQFPSIGPDKIRDRDCAQDVTVVIEDRDPRRVRCRDRFEGRIQVTVDRDGRRAGVCESVNRQL